MYSLVKQHARNGRETREEDGAMRHARFYISFLQGRISYDNSRFGEGKVK